MFRDRLQQDMATLFQRLPMLSGFSVHSDLSTADVWLNTWPGWDPSAEVAEEIGRVLEDLLDERPDAAELLRGRTFARSLQ